jgi:hypothetical protein
MDAFGAEEMSKNKVQANLDALQLVIGSASALKLSATIKHASQTGGLTAPLLVAPNLPQLRGRKSAALSVRLEVARNDHQKQLKPTTQSLMLRISCIHPLSLNHLPLFI